MGIHHSAPSNNGGNQSFKTAHWVIDLALVTSTRARNAVLVGLLF